MSRGFFHYHQLVIISELFDTDSKQPAELRPFMEKVKKLSRTQFASVEAVVDGYLKM